MALWQVLAGGKRRLARRSAEQGPDQLRPSRRVEGENPLYLSRVKVYTASCARGPCVATPDEIPDLSSLLISLRAVRGGSG